MAAESRPKHPSAPAMQASAPTSAPPPERPDEPAVAALCPKLLPLAVSLKDAAAAIGCSSWTIRAYLATGVLRQVRLPGPGARRLLIRYDDVQKLVEENTG